MIVVGGGDWDCDSLTVILSHLIKTRIQANIPPFYWYLNSICLTLFLNIWPCIKQYRKSVSVARVNISEMSVHLTNIACFSLHL